MSETHSEKHGIRWFDVSRDPGVPLLVCPACQREEMTLLRDDAQRRYQGMMNWKREAERTYSQFDLRKHLHLQRIWSEQTFGPGERTIGIVDHIQKELREVVDSDGRLDEWIDVVILALDGAWRCGHEPEAIIEALVAKQVKNEGRTWPDWRTAEPGKAIEHDRSAEGAA